MKEYTLKSAGMFAVKNTCGFKVIVDYYQANKQIRYSAALIICANLPNMRIKLVFCDL